MVRSVICFVMAAAAPVVFFYGAGVCVFGQPQDSRGEIPRVMYVYDPGDKPDPFVAPIDESGQRKKSQQTREIDFQKRIKNITVNGILWDAAVPLVMVNNRIYKSGDTVEDMIIESIGKNEVGFDYLGLKHKVAIIKPMETGVQGGTNEK